MKHNQTQELPLGDAVGALLDECQTILPGIQALFGFQLIAVFNQGFDQKLTVDEQRIHLLAIAFVALAGALIMTPTAYHRQTAPREASEGFILLASRLLLIAMFPLILGIGLEFYLVSRIILQNSLLSGVLAAILVSIFASLWYLLPRSRTLHGLTGREGH